ncbi:hypothetical protein [Cryptosporangium aurantiacum]|uniref:Predicted transcriptional regulator n=1 Tax=Cryptosporangium aurantiacum TaxID=134849 RepID=A0A1M7QXD0_9ACTN|nr:hypothetical protein [Cryptosporangium aurantiacum]SHN36681.1 Predicted transcriptional regulator [Cryptosporangium aurantiacum]
MSAPRATASVEAVATVDGPRRWAAVPEALDELTAARATGALHVEGTVGGSIYLVDGEVYYVHTSAAPGVDCLLQASGTVSPAVFQTAWTAGAAAGQVGEVLIKSGALSRGEAELCTSAAIIDGAYVLLTASPAEAGPVRFAPGEGHWWGALRRVGTAGLDAQVRKRRRLLERTPPGDIDDQPVVAAGRLGRHHVVLTDVQWELIVHADGRRSPRELARLLGRSAFNSVLEARRLVTAGLIRVAARGTTEAPTWSTADDAPKNGVQRESAARTASTPAVEDSTPAEPQPETEGWRSGLLNAAGRGSGSRRKPDLPRRDNPGQPTPLPRRQPGAALRGVVPVGPRADGRSDNSILDVPEPDQGLLSRVRTALEGLR